MVTLKNIHFAYKHNNPVLKAINLELTAGHVYGLLGKNGEGKTTLLNLLSGQLLPTDGECTVLNETPFQRKVNFLQQIFIQPEELKFQNVTATEYIRMYAPFYPTFSENIRAKCFDDFDIDPKGKVIKMSLGQKKKLAISLALAVHTPLLFLDEPTNGLDIPSKSIFRKALASSLDENQSVIISTHQVRDLESLIDSVIILERGRLLLNESIESISEKLFFRVVSPQEKTFYTESSPMGLMGVGENKNGEETPVSLELLFQATVQKPKEIVRIFNH
jgi:ABC-2 type transport system ATP-binding protein